MKGKTLLQYNQRVPMYFAERYEPQRSIAVYNLNQILELDFKLDSHFYAKFMILWHFQAVLYTTFCEFKLQLLSYFLIRSRKFRHVLLQS